MQRFGFRWCFASHLLVLLAASSAVAAPPLFNLLPFKKVEADSKKTYTLTKENGPWMILAISLAGDDRMANAQKIALEIRRDYRLEAWVHEQEIDNGETTIGLGVDKYGNPRKMKNMRGGSSREVAVLVGNYEAPDEPEAVKTLETLRSAKIKAMSSIEKTEKSPLNSLRNYYLASSSQRNRLKERGLLGRAFITRNPLLPVEDVAKTTLDPFVVDLNRGVEYSLLDNKGQYTVVIGTFRGASAYSEKDFVASANKVTSTQGDTPLDKATKDAMLVVAQLREEGVEAYVFHDRHESLITVGSFNEIGMEMPDGHIELPRAIAKVIKQFEPQKTSDLNQLAKGQVAMIPRTVEVAHGRSKYRVPLDVSPRIIQVPRESIADVYRER